jgi:predicted dehydrogenase
MGIRIGVCGVGDLASHLIPLFKHHPDVDNVVLCDLNREKLEAKSREFGIPDVSPSLDDLCGTDVDAIAIITQHHLHGPQAVQVLDAGKHVYSAVPPAMTVEEVSRLVQTAERSDRVYMLGETSYYYPCTLYCRQRHRNGDFGHIVYSEAEYYHDYSHGLIETLQTRHGVEWRRYANWPPLTYPTHSVSMVVSVTGAHATHVSSMGVVDRHPDGLFRGDDQAYDNHFSNETMLCRMSDGSVARFNEFRRIGHPETVRMRMYGTEASYEQQTGSEVWMTRDGPHEDLVEELACKGVPADPENPHDTDSIFKGVSSVHPVHRLPREFIRLPSGHAGSHQFLVHEFVTACVNNSIPPINVWDAARYVLPGLIGHQSALKGGELMEVPDFGDAPEEQA